VCIYYAQKEEREEEEEGNDAWEQNDCIEKKRGRG
jgi:hypothetical protein